MVVNPFVALFDAPVETLTALAYVCVLCAALTATWYAGGRNLLTLYDEYQEGWLVLVPFSYMLRVIAMFLILAVDCLLIAGVIYVLT